MKVVGLIGSPRKGGNSERLVNELLDSVNGDTKVYFLNDLDMKPCQACMACTKGDCVQNDDANKVVDDIVDADVLVFGSPVYFGQMTAQSKIMVDRLYPTALNPNKSVKGKKVITIFTQGMPENVFGDYIDSLKQMPFGYLGMEVVESVVAMGQTDKNNEESLKPYIDQVREIGSKL